MGHDRRHARMTLLLGLIAVLLLLTVTFSFAYDDYTSRLTNPGFEGYSGWTIESTGTQMYYRGPIGWYPYEGSTAYIFGTSGSYGVPHSVGDSCYATQSVDLTDVSALTFFHAGSSEWTEARVYVGNDLVFTCEETGTGGDDWAVAWVDVSDYSGTHSLKFGVTVIADYGGTPQNGYYRFDKASLFGGADLGVHQLEPPVMQPEPAVTPASYSNTVYWDHPLGASIDYCIQGSTTPDFADPYSTTTFNVEEDGGLRAALYYFGGVDRTYYYRCRAERTGVHIGQSQGFWEDFESGTLDGWSPGPSPVTSDVHVIEGMGANGTDHCLMIVKPSGVSWGDGVYRQVTAPDAERLSLYVRTATGDSSGAMCWLSLWDASWNGVIGTYLDEHGRVGLANSGSVLSSASVPTHEWLPLTLEFDWDAKTVDLYVNGALALEGVAMVDSSATSDLGVIALCSLGPSVSFFDEITIHSGDQVAQVSEWSNVVSTTISNDEDETPPVVTITSPEDEERCAGLSAITGTANDPAPSSGIYYVDVELCRFSSQGYQYWSFSTQEWSSNWAHTRAEGTTTWAVYGLPTEWPPAAYWVDAYARDNSYNDSPIVRHYFTPVTGLDPPTLVVPATISGDSFDVTIQDPNDPPADAYLIQVASDDNFDPVWESGWIERTSGSGTAALHSLPLWDEAVAMSDPAQPGSWRSSAVPSLTVLAVLVMALSSMLVTLGPARRRGLRIKWRRGFVLTELLVNLSIIAIVAALLLPAFQAHLRLRAVAVRADQSLEQKMRDAFNYQHYYGYAPNNNEWLQWVPWEAVEGGYSFRAEMTEDGEIRLVGTGGRLLRPTGFVSGTELGGLKCDVTPDFQLPGDLISFDGPFIECGEFKIQFNADGTVTCTLGDTDITSTGHTFAMGEEHHVQFRRMNPHLEFREVTGGQPWETEPVLVSRAEVWIDGTQVGWYDSDWETEAPSEVSLGLSPSIGCEGAARFDNLEVTASRPPVFRFSDWSDTVSTYWSKEPLTISNLEITDITTTGCTVNWETNIDGSSVVALDTSSHGTWEDYPQTFTGPGDTQQHAVPLFGLQPETEYFIRAKTVNGDGREVVSDELSFNTASLLHPLLSYCGDTSATVGGNVLFAADLSADGTPVAGETITLSCEDWNGTATTNADGIASVTLPAGQFGVGTHTVVVVFAGAEGLAGAEDSGEVTIIAESVHLVVNGKGKFYREGDPKQRCKFDLKFDRDALTGSLKYKDKANDVDIEADVVTSVTVFPDGNSGPEARIIFVDDGVTYTLRVDADTNYFSLERDDGSYSADSGHSSEDECEITIDREGSEG